MSGGGYTCVFHVYCLIVRLNIRPTPQHWSLYERRIQREGIFERPFGDDQPLRKLWGYPRFPELRCRRNTTKIMCVILICSLSSPLSNAHLNHIVHTQNLILLPTRQVWRCCEEDGWDHLSGTSFAQNAGCWVAANICAVRNGRPDPQTRLFQRSAVHRTHWRYPDSRMLSRYPLQHPSLIHCFV